MLRVTLLGNLGADPEARYTAKGNQVVTFRVAVNQVRTGPDGERQENTEWFRVRAMGPKAEFAQRLSKGSKVLVIGRLDIGQYTGRDGESRVSYDVWADEIQTMSPRGAPMESEALDGEREAEPALAGVSSMRGNGKSTRRGESAPEAPSADLEDLPF